MSTRPEQRLKAGLIGHPGRLGGLLNMQHLDVRAFSEIVADKRAWGEKEYGLRGYADYHEMLEKEKLELVDIATPNFVHAQPTVDSLAAGAHVYCEKPMAIKMEDCRSMLAAEQKSGRCLQVGLELRYSKITKRMKEIVDSGEIGQVKNIYFFHIPGMWLYDPPWRVERERAGGMFLEKLVHEVDLFRWYVGEIKSVQVFTAENVLPQYGYCDNLYAIFFFENGALGNITTMHGRGAMNVAPELYHQAGHELTWSIIGTQGAMVTDLWTQKLMVMHYRPAATARPALTTELDREENYESLSTQIAQHDTPGFMDDFARRMIHGEQPLMSAADTLKTMAVCFAAEASALDGKRHEVQG